MTPEEEIVTKACLSRSYKDGFGMGSAIGVVVGLCLGLIIPLIL